MFRSITTLRTLSLCGLLLFAAGSRVTAQGYYDDAYGNSGSYQQFYDELSPYGQWMNDPQYGYVWVPDVGDDFRPYYTNGNWVNSDYGNTWVSNYRWGWAPFHYGRWTYSNYYGWLWVPGNVWGPAWVSWRSGGGNYGWAPLGPGISVSMSFGNGWNAPEAWWNFTPQQYILTPGFQRYCYGPRYNQRYVQQTTIINNTYVNNNNTYITGPRRPDLERAVGRRVTPVTINNSRRPGEHELRGNNLSVYRPAIAEGRRATERPQQVSTIRQPIAEGTRQTAGVPERNSFRQGAVPAGRGDVMQQQAAHEQGMRTDRSNLSGRTDDARQTPDRSGRAVQVQPQPNRSVFEQRRPERTVQPLEQPATRQRNWGSSPQVQQPQPERGMDAARMQEMRRQQQAQRIERSAPSMPERAQQAQRFERPSPRMPEQRQPRMEQQRAMPQMQEQRQAPQPRMERSAPQPQGVGGGRRAFGR